MQRHISLTVSQFYTFRHDLRCAADWLDFTALKFRPILVDDPHKNPLGRENRWLMLGSGVSLAQMAANAIPVC